MKGHDICFHADLINIIHNYHQTFTDTISNDHVFFEILFYIKRLGYRQLSDAIKLSWGMVCNITPVTDYM